MNTRKNVRGFTLIELLVVIAIIALLIGILLPALGKARKSAQQLKDSTQIRGVIQALATWAGDNKGDYPLPSKLDRNGYTILNSSGTAGERDEAKDITGQIISPLVNNGSVTAELFISPVEQNPSVAEYENYQVDEPEAAEDELRALWDPAMRGTPEEEEGDSLGTMIDYGVTGNDLTGNTSYAHTMPVGKRLAQWTDTFIASEPVLANRGPVFEEVQSAGMGADLQWQLTDESLQSNTLLIHGGRTTWEGNVGYNDGHVDFENTASPDQAAQIQVSSANANGGDAFTRNDNLFVSENDATGEADLTDNGTDFVFTQLNEVTADTGQDNAFQQRNAWLNIIADNSDRVSGDPEQTLQLWKD